MFVQNKFGTNALVTSLFVASAFGIVGGMAARTQEPRSRRERPAKPPLTRDGIVSAAVEIMRAEGLAKVTTRRIAQALDTGPASLYVYVSNTAELHALILDRLLGTLAIPVGGPWQERIEELLGDYTALLYGHPELARSALITRPRGENQLRLAEALLDALDEGGVPRAQAAWGVDLLLQQATATAAEHSARDRTADSEGEWQALVRAVHEAPADRYPHVAALAPMLVSGAPRERMRWMLRAMLAGIGAVPVPEDARQGPRPGDPEPQWTP